MQTSKARQFAYGSPKRVRLANGPASLSSPATEQQSPGHSGSFWYLDPPEPLVLKGTHEGTMVMQ